MPIDFTTATRGDVVWWADRLVRRLQTRRYSPRWSRERPNPDGTRPPYELLNDYLRGEPPLTGMNQKWSPTSREFLRLARMNYAPLLVGSVSDRIVPVGWRTAADDDRDGDQVAAELAEANELQLRIADGLRWMLSMSESYLTVGPDPGNGFPAITAEDPRFLITADDILTGRCRAALRVVRDEWDDQDRMYVSVQNVPTEQPKQWVFYRDTKGTSFTRWGIQRGGWEFSDDHGGDAGQVIEGDRIPIFPLVNEWGVGEYEAHLDVLDRINDQIFDRVTVAKQQAFVQRALKNLPREYPEDHALAGQPIEYDPNLFSADPGALWDLPPGTDIWEGKQSDLTGLRLVVKDDVEQLAAVTRTPLHMITPDAASGSAEGAATMREAHVFRVEDRRRRLESRLNRVMALALSKVDGAEPDRSKKVRTIWGPAERHSLQQKMSAAAQAKAGGLPQASIWTDIQGYTPADLPRLEKERRDDLLFAASVEDAVSPDAR